MIKIKLSERGKILLLILGIVFVTSGAINVYARHLEIKVEKLWELYLSENLAIRRFGVDQHLGN